MDRSVYHYNTIQYNKNALDWGLKASDRWIELKICRNVGHNMKSLWTSSKMYLFKVGMIRQDGITKRGKFYFKTRQLFYYKTGQGLLQNAAGITKRGKGYYKTRQVLQNGARVITKRGRYYKTGQLLQNGAVQGGHILPTAGQQGLIE